MPKKHNRIKRAILSLFVLLFVLFLTVFFLLQIEKRLIPPLKEISHIQCKTLANQIIDAAVEDTLHSLELSKASLLLETDSEGYTANTALVNRFCSALSSRITNNLSTLPDEVIKIPLGAATNVSFLANKGPSLPFTLVPMGIVKTDYETAFQSVGINQINYKIWIHLSIELKIVNPLYQETLQMERKMMLADLIFSGKVPTHYFQMGQPNEYLLTE